MITKCYILVVTNGKCWGSVKKAELPASFLIQVQFRQNATWQGSIQWLDKKKTQRFRSTLELIQLMDSALDSRGPDEKAVAAWNDSDAGTVPAQKQEEKEDE